METAATNALGASNEMTADTPSDQAVFSDNSVPSNDSLAMAPEQPGLASTLARVRDSFDQLDNLRQGEAEAEGGLDSMNTSLPKSTEADQFPPLNEIARVGSGDLIEAEVAAGSIVLAPKPVIDASSEQHDSANQDFSMIFGWSVCGWMAGSVLLVIWQTIRFRRVILRVEDASAFHQRVLENVLARVHVKGRKIHLAYSNAFDEPVACGVFRWTILLPKKSVEQLSQQELDALLAHEVAHLVRGDILWLQIGRLLRSCFAFQPLNFVATRHWNLATEFLCDDWAVTHAVDPIVLAKSLTTVAEWRTTRRVHQGAFATGERRSHVLERVERLLETVATDWWTSRRVRFVVGSAGLVLAIVLASHGPRMMAQEPASRPEPDERTESSRSDFTRDTASGLFENSTSDTNSDPLENRIRDSNAVANERSISPTDASFANAAGFGLEPAAEFTEPETVVLQQLLEELGVDTNGLHQELADLAIDLEGLEKLLDSQKLSPDARAELNQLLQRLSVLKSVQTFDGSTHATPNAEPEGE